MFVIKNHREYSNETSLSINTLNKMNSQRYLKTKTIEKA